MPKLIEYPRASFNRTLDLANAIDYLGGSCSIQSAADKLGLKLTGAFTALIGATKKHELIDSGKEGLVITETFKKIKLAYNDEEKRQNMRLAFLAPPLYRKIYEKFKGKELPMDMMSKLLIREYGVDQDISARIVGYFVEGARGCEILIDNKIIDIDSSGVLNSEDKLDIRTEEHFDKIETTSKEIIDLNNFTNNNQSQNEIYTVQIIGPGINSKLTIADPDDFIILEAMLSKLKKKIN